MGLAPYGKPKYIDLIYNNLISLNADGSFQLNMKYFKFHRGLEMISNNFVKLFGRKSRKPEEEIDIFYMDIAASIQFVTEEVVLRISKNLYKITNQENLCLSGGVALNCVANGKIIEKSGFKNVWIQPASGDSGSAIGCALAFIYDKKNISRKIFREDSMSSSYLGPYFDDISIKKYLDQLGVSYKFCDNESLYNLTAEFLSSGYVVGWFQGKMEFGPRALGARSIIGDPRNQEMQSVMNLKIKYRESFRPFAPSVLEEDVASQFELKNKSPYMLLVSPVKKELCTEMTEEQKQLFGIDKLNIPRSTLPAITHVDYSARVQTVSKDTNPRYYNLINSFKKLTSCPLIVNTSFNVRGEPIVCTPQDAYRCFMRTEMDILVLQNQFLHKYAQPKTEKDETWKQEFELD
jgi:carbamoyltransferase